jgi:DNA-binding SARP family transcriptional activator
MPRRMRLELLGGFRARSARDSACALPTRKSEALLAYLALPPGRFHSRDSLAALLWGDTSESNARQSLRQALGALRRALGEDVVIARGDTIALDAEAVAVDVVELEAAIADGGREALARAAALYTGDLLAGFRVDEAPFEEWRTVQCERLHELGLEAMARLLAELLRSDEVEPAIQTAMRILALDPLQEAIHRTLMRLLLQQGRRAAALQQYQSCLVALERELGTEPEEQTRNLYRDILRTVKAAPATETSSRPWVAGMRVADTPMVGRRGELARLDTAISRMLDGGGHVVLVAGEAGIGKSRLIQEALSGAGARVGKILFGRCHQTEQTLPFRPWIEALRGRSALDAAVHARLSRPARSQLGALFPELLESAESAGTTAPALFFEPMLELIAALAADHPIIVTIEDLHWADMMSTRLLAFLGRRLHHLPVLIIGSLRSEELVDAPALRQAVRELRDEGRLEELSLEPLSETETRELATALRPSARAGRDWRRLARELWTVSEGNPFVIVESMRSVAEHGPDAWMRKPRLGRRVQDFIAARVEALPKLPRECVAVAAAIGRDFSLPLLSRAVGLGERETAEAVETLVRRRIFDAVDDRLDFCHDWVRFVAYESLLPPKRAMLHAAVGDALTELNGDRLDDIADALGTHYSRAGDARRAIPHLVRFAELAAQRYALDVALATLRQAMDGTEQLPAGERDRRRLDIALRQAFVLSLLARHREVLDLLAAHAGHVARVGNPALAAEYYFRLSLTHLYFCEQEQGQLAAEQSLHEAERSGDPEPIGKALHVLSLVSYGLGIPRAGVEHATRALPLLDRPRTQHYLALAYNDLALNHIIAGTLGSALEAAEQALVIGRAARDTRVQAMSGYVKAWVLALQGDCERALETAQVSVEMSPELLARGLATVSLGHAHLERGDAAAAIVSLEKAVDILTSIPIRWAARRAMVLLSEACLLKGDFTRARATAERALELARAERSPFYVAHAQRALGRIAAESDAEAALRWLSEALATFRQCDSAFEAARTQLALVHCGARVGRTAESDVLTAAIAAFEAAQAPRRVAETRALANKIGVAVGA